MGQKEHKAQVKSITMRCSIPLQINSLLKGCFISCVSSPICQCMKLNTTTTHLKIIWSGQLKIYSPHLCCPASGLLFMKKQPPRLDRVPLLRTRQPYYLNKVSSFHSTHIILCQESQLLLCVLEKFFPCITHRLLFFPTFLHTQTRVLH